MDDDLGLDLGPCCVCERTGDSVCNLVCLNKRCPIPGRGWNCVVCDIPSDGAMAVVCEACMVPIDRGEQVPEDILKFACRGYPGTDGRVPIGDLIGTHEHDMSRHEEGD